MKNRFRYYCTNGVNTPTNKLVINSSSEYVVFKNGKSVLMLPPLKPYVWLIENSEKDGKITDPDFENHIWEFKDFHSSLLKVLDNLEGGFYKFEWYFYIHDFKNVHNGLSQVYTYDPFNKDSFNLVLGNFGYTKFGIIIIEYLNEKENRLSIHTNICYLITERLREILENELTKSIMDLNKDTLLVITKSSKEEYDEEDGNIEYKNIFAPGLRVGEIKYF